MKRLDEAQKGEETNRPLNLDNDLGAIVEEHHEDYEGGVKAPTTIRKSVIDQYDGIDYDTDSSEEEDED